MKKNRNSFFNEQTDFTQFNQNVYSQNMQNPNMPNPNMMYPPAAPGPNMPYPQMPQVGASSSYYAGPSMNSDIDSRLAKMERQINRLEHRISKLEQNTTLSTDDYNSNINDMYMV